jgi:hypothetical protein
MYSCGSCDNDLSCLTCPSYDVTGRIDSHESANRCDCDLGYYDQGKQICGSTNFLTRLECELNCMRCVDDRCLECLGQHRSILGKECPCLAGYYDVEDADSCESNLISHRRMFQQLPDLFRKSKQLHLMWNLTVPHATETMRV